jgi:hypothetical protein
MCARLPERPKEKAPAETGAPRVMQSSRETRRCPSLECDHEASSGHPRAACDNWCRLRSLRFPLGGNPPG